MKCRNCSDLLIQRRDWIRNEQEMQTTGRDMNYQKWDHRVWHHCTNPVPEETEYINLILEKYETTS